MFKFGSAFRFLYIAGLLFVTSLNTAGAQDINQYEKRLDKTIKTACHSYLVDALPNALSWLRDEIYEKSPFCKRINAADDAEDINDALQEQFSRRSASDPTLDLSKKRDRRLNITIDCRSEYMCMESRLRFQDTANPVSQKQYDVVAQYCGGRYGCIQAFFNDWPQKLPNAKAKDAAKMLTFDNILNPALTPKGTQISPATTVQPVQNNVAKAAPAAPAPLPTGQRASNQNQQLSQNVKAKCTCSLNGRPCFDNPYGPIRKRMAQIEAQRLSICTAWQGTYGNLAPSSPVSNEQMQADLTYSLSYIKDADARGNHLIRLAAEDFERIRYRAAKRIPYRNTFEEAKADQLASGPSQDVGPAPDGFGEQQFAQSKATTPTAATSKPADFLYHPQRLNFADAKAFCQSKGMHLPTVAEAKAKLAQMRSLGDPYWGIWTTDQSSSDKMVGRYRTLRNNGFTEGEFAQNAQRVFCFP